MTSTEVFPEGLLSMYLLIYLVRHLKTLEVDESLASCYKSATPLNFSPPGIQNGQKYFFGQAVSFNKFHWCLVDNTEQLRVGRGSSTAKLNPTPKYEGGFRQLEHTTLPAHSTSRAQALPAWPACLSVAADLSQSYMCLSLHPPHLLC